MTPPEPSPHPGLHAFAFQTGHWRVHHRKLRRRLAGCSEWDEFTGTCTASELLGGAGNVDDHWLDDPAGAYRAATFRRLDPATGVWSIWWADGRRGGLDAPVTGRFAADGAGTFTGQDTHEGRPIVIRFVWSGIMAEHALWEQAFSADGGASWEVNWVMAFDRNGGLIPTPKVINFGSRIAHLDPLSPLALK